MFRFNFNFINIFIALLILWLVVSFVAAIFPLIVILLLAWWIYSLVARYLDKRNGKVEKFVWYKDTNSQNTTNHSSRKHNNVQEGEIVEDDEN